MAINDVLLEVFEGGLTFKTYLDKGEERGRGVKILRFLGGRQLCIAPHQNLNEREK